MIFEQWKDGTSTSSHGEKYSLSLFVCFVKALHILPKILINHRAFSVFIGFGIYPYLEKKLELN